MRNIRAYIGRLFWTAFRLWNRHEAVTVLVGAFIAALLALISAYGLQVLFNFDAGTYFAVTIFGWFVLIVLIVTPYQIWREDSEKLATLEDMQRPRIALGEVAKESSTDGSTSIVYVTVRNIDPRRRELTDCILYIVDYIDQSGNIVHSRRPLRTRNQKTPGSGRFYLRPEQPKEVMVARLNETDPDALIELGYADPEQGEPFITRDRRLHITITAYANDGGSATQDYHLYVDDDGTLTLKAAP